MARQEQNGKTFILGQVTINDVINSIIMELKFYHSNITVLLYLLILKPHTSSQFYSCSASLIAI